jgi:hypothetical protein
MPRGKQGIPSVERIAKIACDRLFHYAEADQRLGAGVFSLREEVRLLY